MPYDPGLDWFISFYDLNPSRQDKCIYFTQKPNTPRCRCSCDRDDRNQAIELRREITTMPPEAVSIEMLEDYIQLNCCRFKNAQHRDRIEDVGYLRPLAQRWQDEIWRHAQYNPTTPVPAPDDGIYTRNGYPTPAPSTPSHTRTLNTPIASPYYYQPSAAPSFGSNAAPSTPVANSLDYHYGYATPAPSTPRYSTTPYAATSSPAYSQSSSSYHQYDSPISSPPLQPYGNQQRYNLRPREGDNSTDSPQSFPQAPLSEFRPHIARPLPSDSIARKICEPLEDRDFETGSLYIFDRASSPGHVKIGWTASSVQRRLEDWSKCGYIPNLLFTVDWIPHAQRVETLTHYELIKQWRRERRCKAEWCQKSHKEWFEIDKEQAKQVLRNWADFMLYAEPYDSSGRLKSQWREAVKIMEGYGEMVTASKLLEHYEESLLKQSTVVKAPQVVSAHTPNIVEEVVTGYEPKARHLEVSEEEVLHVGSSKTEQPTMPKEAPLITDQPLLKSTQDVKAEPLPTKQSLFAPELPNLLKESPSLDWQPLPKVGPLTATEPLPRRQFLFSAEQPTRLKDKPLFEWQPLLKTGSLPKTEALSGTQSLFSTEQHTPSKTPLFQWQPLPKTESLFDTKPPPETEFQSSSGLQQLLKAPFVADWRPVLTPRPFPKPRPLFNATPLPSTQFVFSSKQPFHPDPWSNITPPLKVETLPRTESVVKNEQVDDEEIAPKAAPVKEELLPEQIPLPPSPLLQPADLRKDTNSLEETEQNTSDRLVKEGDSDLSATVADTSTNSEASSSAPVSRSATPTESSLPTHAQSSAGNTITQSPHSRSATSASLVTDTSEVLPSLSSDSEEEAVKTPTSVTQCQQTLEDAEQVEPEDKHHGREKETFKEKDETIAAVTELEPEVVGWDEEETLVEEQTPKSLEKVALEIVDGIYNDISTGKANGALKVLDELKVPDSEPQPAIEMVSQA